MGLQAGVTARCVWRIREGTTARIVGRAGLSGVQVRRGPAWSQLPCHLHGRLLVCLMSRPAGCRHGHSCTPQQEAAKLDCWKFHSIVYCSRRGSNGDLTITGWCCCRWSWEPLKRWQSSALLDAQWLSACRWPTWSLLHPLLLSNKHT